MLPTFISGYVLLDLIVKLIYRYMGQVGYKLQVKDNKDLPIEYLAFMSLSSTCLKMIIQFFQGNIGCVLVATHVI